MCCFLAVRSSNDTARVLYDCLGFVDYGFRKNYYSVPVEDALFMRNEMNLNQGRV